MAATLVSGDRRRSERARTTGGVSGSVVKSPGVQINQEHHFGSQFGPESDPGQCFSSVRLYQDSCTGSVRFPWAGPALREWPPLRSSVSPTTSPLNSASPFPPPARRDGRRRRQAVRGQRVRRPRGRRRRGDQRLRGRCPPPRHRQEPPPGERPPRLPPLRFSQLLCCSSLIRV